MKYLSPSFQTQLFKSFYKHRNYRLFFLGNVISLTGNWLHAGAETWLILQLTHSALAVGILSVALNGPYALLGLFGSVINDHFDRRQTLIWTQTALMLCSGLLAGLTLLHRITVWEVDTIAAVCSLIYSLNNPARQAFIFQIVGREDLPNAIALNASAANIARVLGPGIGGFLIAIAGVGLCFSLNAVSYLGVIFALLMMRPGELYHTQESQGKLPSVFHGLHEGFGYIWHTPLILLTFTILLVVMTIGINFDVLLPVLAARTLHGGPEIYGLFSTCLSIGSLVGSIIFVIFGRPSWSVLLFSLGGLGLLQIFLAPVQDIRICILLLIMIGICYTLYTTTSNVIIQLTTSSDLQGRITGLYSYIVTGVGPLGSIASSWLCQEGGTFLAFLVAGGIGVIMALIGMVTFLINSLKGRQIMN